MQVDYIKCWPWDDKLPPNGRGPVHMTSFFLILPPIIFATGEARHFNFCIMIDTQEYYCMRDKLPPKRMSSESRDFFIFWETDDNISLTVQDRDIAAMED